MLDSTQQVIFRFSTGTLDQQGFSINAEIHTASEHLETDATLPPHPALQSAYEQLRERYQQQCCGPAASFRSLKFLNEPTHLSIRDTCNDLTQHLDAWLESPEFKPIREDLLHHLNPAQPVRFLIRTNNATLQWLPWHFCHLLNRYQYGGIALCLPQRSHHIPPQNLKPFVRVLPILGDSTGIDIQADLELLKDKLPHDAQILDPLIGITCAELGEKLWQAEADILFFAGHSSSTNPRGVGELYLNKTDSVTISELRNALTKAIQKGLKLAIFNSCDGLKLAADLADLNLPATIVMREPIPDAAAQFFLEAFLTSFADPEHPKPISLAVREAQERLQHLEQDFPFASGLPVLCQQTDSPDLTWQDLRQKEPETLPSPNHDHLNTPLLSTPSPPLVHQGIAILIIGLFSTLGAMLLASTGHLTPLELALYDWMTRLTAPNIVDRDPRILVVTIDESDIQYQDDQGMDRLGSLADEALVQAIERLELITPSTLGLHIYRPYDFQLKATRQLAQDSRFHLICKYNPDHSSEPNITTAKGGLPIEQSGFSNVIADHNNSIVRRIYVAAFPPENEQYCRTFYSFSTALTLHHLQQIHNIELETDEDGYWILNTVTLKTVERDAGGYVNLPNEGDQLLLRYQQHNGDFENVFHTISLQELLQDGIPKWLTEVLHDPIVIIGNTAYDYNSKEFLTPFGKPIFGTFLNAQAVSYLLGITLDGKPQIRWLDAKGESFWVLCWAMLSVVLALRTVRSFRYWWGTIGLTISLGGTALLLFSQSWWLPIVPPFGVIWMSYTGVKLWLRCAPIMNIHSKKSRPHTHQINLL
ncbi:CHASE2 domain-containing protein [Spirulina major CS-329]|uniref:CHASE2 domain-containing protein n=1 Tax=Spirulina TaxID=1154 RepID=UPI00232D3449|nr:MULTISPECIES: CHASE2 domain-containing protein [Spirulina]MDB9495800.1 CHASE2 domain-containing protein [Spirulina subsalsa CS-330]MDB9504297.1 CHASE2 domain-containing protein [Spirulina major CS-329]